MQLIHIEPQTSGEAGGITSSLRCEIAAWRKPEEMKLASLWKLTVYGLQHFQQHGYWVSLFYRKCHSTGTCLTGLTGIKPDYSTVMFCGCLKLSCEKINPEDLREEGFGSVVAPIYYKIYMYRVYTVDSRKTVSSKIRILIWKQRDSCFKAVRYIWKTINH